MRFYGYCDRMYTHWYTTVPLASHNKIKVDNKKKEGRNRGEKMKRWREWTNRKKHDRFGDGWDCCLLAVIVSR